MQTIDFSKIAPRNGSPNDAFEELCCQLAHRAAAPDSAFDRFRGSGGDGGVECLERTKDGRVIGWQAKYVSTVKKLVAQADGSLTTALTIHHVSEFVLCYPFNPTPPTGKQTRTGKRASSDHAKLNAWVDKRVRQAQSLGHRLTITLMSASRLEALLHEHDPKGGLREYFFNATILSPGWFGQHLERAANAAEPRYSPDLKLDTPLYRWFQAFEAGPVWKEEVQQKLHRLDEAIKQFCMSTSSISGDHAKLPALSTTTEPILSCLELGKAALQNMTKQSLGAWIESAQTALEEHRRFVLEVRNTQLHLKRNQRWESPLLRFLDSLADWLQSPTCFLGFHRVFVLTGEGGSGKTHGICDMALKRHAAGAYSCVLFGHQFDGQPTEWVRAAESLGLPNSLGQDALLDALNSAAEASGHTLILWIDAVNETAPRDYWRKRLKAFAGHVAARPFLRLCVSCRTSFTPISLPETHDYPELEHHGFAGMERLACKKFFEHYGLTPPLAPLLQPEMSNPLYLKLVCQTLKNRGLKHLPPGWLGVASVIRAFIDEKEKRFADEHSTSVSAGAGTVGRSLHAIASKMAELRKGRLRFSEAQEAINHSCPHASNLGVLNWLIQSDLLSEDGCKDFTTGQLETEVRLSFERLSDFLIASRMMPDAGCANAQSALARSGELKRLFNSSGSVQSNAGWVAALSLLFAERWDVELPFLFSDSDIRLALLPIAMRALAWRSPTDFTDSTRQLARFALFEGSKDMRDSLLRVSCQPSKIDAMWLHNAMREKPIWERDPFWCSYLLDSYERDGIVASLIEAGSAPDIGAMNTELASRWALLLCWFTAAADRRLKDSTTRALTRVFSAHPNIIAEVVSTMQGVDDDDLIERVLLSAYGALIIKRDASVAESLARLLLEAYQSDPESFQNAQIRDLIRCVGELAKHLNTKVEGIAPSLPTTRRKCAWTPELPDAAEMKRWSDWQGDHGALYKAVHSCTDDDFNHYSIGCLSPWMEKFGKVEIGQWLSNHLVKAFHLDSKAFDQYDEDVHSYGHGRSKPSWAERIGKKYQWIALNRLASRLHDKLPRERTGWKPDPVRQPLILQEERKLDPSIPTPVLPERSRESCWWAPAQMNLAATKHLSFNEWAKLRDDLPEIEVMLGRIENGAQGWRTLHTMQSWSEYDEKEGSDSPYRSSWFHLRSYLVPTREFGDMVAAIGQRNFYQGWLPEGGSWLHCFLGEYPWATAFNTEPDSYMGAGSELRGTDLKLIHSANTINCEWAYDGTLKRSIEFLVPAKPFFKRNQLRWNGGDGFETKSGRILFRDPHATQGGEAALIADADILPKTLKTLGYRLVWTLLGGKDVLGERHNENTPTEVFSQFAYLDEQGEVVVEPRRFYLDSQKDIYPDPSFLSNKPRPPVEFTVNSIRFNR